MPSWKGTFWNVVERKLTQTSSKTAHAYKHRCTECLPLRFRDLCVYVCVCVWWLCVFSSQPVGSEFKPHSGNFPSVFFLICLPPAPPVHPGCDWVPGIFWGANSRPFLMQQQWSRWDFGCPHHLLVSKGLFSCEFLAQLQELCLHGSKCLLSVQASWLCQVCTTASGCKRICN